MRGTAADFCGPRPCHCPAAPPPTAVRAARCRAPARPPSSRRPSPLSAAPPSLSPPLLAATTRRGCWPSSRVARHGPRLQRLPTARRRRRKRASGAIPPYSRLSRRPPRLPSHSPLPSARPSLRLLLLPTGRSQHRRPQLLCRPGRRLRLLLRRLRSPSVQPQCCRGSPMSRRGECQALIVPPWHNPGTISATPFLGCLAQDTVVQ